jgi:hypothetical protein
MLGTAPMTSGGRRHRTRFEPHDRSARLVNPSDHYSSRAWLRRPVCSAFAHVSGSAAEKEVVAPRREEIDHLGVFAEPCLVLSTSRNDHNVTPAADPFSCPKAAKT